MSADSSRKRRSNEPLSSPPALIGKRSKSVGHFSSSKDGFRGAQTASEPEHSENIVSRLVQEVEEQTIPTENKVQKKQKRRSSMLAGRINCDVKAVEDPVDLFSKLPENLPTNEKLREIHRIAIDYTLSKCQNVMPRDSDHCIEAVKSSVDSALEKFDPEAQLSQGTVVNDSKPVDLKVEADIASYTADFKRIQIESSAWDEELERMKEASAVAACQAKQPAQCFSDMPTSLSEDRKRFLCNQINYQAKLNQLKVLTAQVTHNELVIKEAFSQLSSSYGSVLDFSSRRLHEKYFNLPSPRTLIKNCLFPNSTT